jgi:acyl-coenzyme A thioesterase PaaI-like protein
MTKMSDKAFQDYYPDHWSHCYGCGRLNEKGLQIKSYWDGEESICTYLPRQEHTAIPGYVYGGLVASLIDCHGTGTAAAAAYQVEGRDMESQPPLRFLTGSLNVKYLKPTPLGPPIELRGRIREIKGRKVVVDITVSVEDLVTATGEVIAIQVPEHLKFETETNE